MSSYRPLLDLTSETLIKRTKCYKGLVIVFSIIGVTALISAIATLSFGPFIGLLLQIPAYIFYLTCDNKKLNQWRRQIMKAWRSKAIEISALKQVVTATNKALLSHTVEGMLETLLEAGDLVEEHSIEKPIRQAAAVAVSTRDSLILYKLFFKAIATTVVTIAIVSATFLKLWLPFLALLLLPVFFIIYVIAKREKISSAKTKIARFAKKEFFDLNKYNEIFKSIDWTGVSKTPSLINDISTPP